MNTVRLDAMRKIEVPGGEPGDIYEIQEQGPGRIVLQRVEGSATRHNRTADEIIAAIKANPLTPRMSWEELRAMTREP